ncbi:MAG: FAD-binding protein, partial [Pseudomonadales bacterium]|nr:FAD-binding protein [Pseudomonadales bacterium]
AQAKQGIVDTPDQHFADIMRLSNGKADPAIARIVADNAADTVNWLLGAGLTPVDGHPIKGHGGRPGYSVARFLWDRREGRAILAIVRQELATLLAQERVSLQLDTRITALVTDAAGAVTGARARVGDSDLTFSARRTLLTTGGYAMNPTLFEQLIHRPAYAATAYPFSRGDGLQMVTAMGGALRGQELHRSGTGSILTSDHYPAKVYARFNTRPDLRQPWEIWVDDSGQRYVREDAPETYERELALYRQPRLRYRIVFDQGILDAAPSGLPEWTHDKLVSHFGTHRMFARADSLASLADKIGVAAATLEATVRDYNAAVSSGHDRLGRQYLPKQIGTPPYYAVTHLGHSATSSTGVIVDGQMRVLRSDGTPMKNLYAAGEVLGSGATVGDAFVPGMMLTPALTLGRLLGEGRLGSP